jgi:pimeloyl-ACP methyl ester carboxylesterase
VNETHIIRLKDGRKLAYAEYGDEHGKPLFFFHGMPGSRFFRPPDEITAKLGVRLIALDRPGYGRSDFQERRGILDWPDDVQEVAAGLGIERFAVAGHSGGGPYVAACAYRLPQVLTAAAILSGAGPVGSPGATHGMAPINQIGFRFGRAIPWPVWRRLVGRIYSRDRSDPERTLARGAGRRPAADADLFADPAIRAVCYQSEVEAFRQGTLGMAWDARLLCGPWGFPLEAISMTVWLWHGTADRDAPLGMGQWVAAKIPRCRAHFCQGEAHLLLFPHWEEILRALWANPG